MKTPYLVVYDYGTGGVWATIAAEGAEAIAQRYPLLKVVEQQPAWMSDGELHRLPRYDIDQDPDEFLRGVMAEAAKRIDP